MESGTSSHKPFLLIAIFGLLLSGAVLWFIFGNGSLESSSVGLDEGGGGQASGLTSLRLKEFSDCSDVKNLAQAFVEGKTDEYRNDIRPDAMGGPNNMLYDCRWQFPEPAGVDVRTIQRGATRIAAWETYYYAHTRDGFAEAFTAPPVREPGQRYIIEDPRLTGRFKDILITKIVPADSVCNGGQCAEENLGRSDRFLYEMRIWNDLNSAYRASHVSLFLDHEATDPVVRYPDEPGDEQVVDLMLGLISDQ